MKQKIITIIILLVLLTGCFWLIMSYTAKIAYADTPVPIIPINTQPGETSVPTMIPTSVPTIICPTIQSYPIDTGYPVYTPIPLPDYPEPEASSPEIELSNKTLQLESIQPEYRNGRNLWQEIVFQFAKLLELIK